MPAPDDGLDLGQGLALIQECASAANLLRDARRAIREMRFVLVGSDSIFTLASIGVEKLMKIVLGLDHLDANGGWPSKATMKSWGHGVSEMNLLVDAALRLRADRATHRPYIDALMTDHASDHYWTLLVKVLDRYGRAGRFYHLDHLADGQAGAWEPPVALWDELENAIIGDRPELIKRLASTNNSVADEARRDLSIVAEHCLERWWELIYRACVQGCFGPRARMISSEIRGFGNS